MIRVGWAVATLCGWLSAAAFAAASSTPSPAGRWLTADRTAVIQIAPCGDGFCGAIAAVHLDHPGDPMPRDWQGQPQCGLTIVQTTAVSGDPGNIIWQGVVLDPRNGVSHPALLFFDPMRNLILRGYLLVPLLGESTTWTKYTGRILAGCHLPR